MSNVPAGTFRLLPVTELPPPWPAFDACVASALTCRLEIIRLNVSFNRS